MFARIALAGLRHRGAGREVTKEAMEESGGVEVGRLETGVGVISTVAAIAPLLGLLGTVTGMIQVFRDVAGTDNPDHAHDFTSTMPILASELSRGSEVFSRIDISRTTP